MKKYGLLLVLAVLFASCDQKKEQKKDSFERTRVDQEATAEKEPVVVPVDLDNKGIGPIQSYKFTEEINFEMATAGEGLYNAKCAQCHMAETIMIGPPMAGIYERRSPEWVLNMILNPIEMVKEDPIAIALYEQYEKRLMTNSGLSEDEAKEVAEYLRTL